MVFPWPNPGLNVSKLFNELVRVPGMTGKLIILEKSPDLRTYDAPALFFPTFSPFLLDDCAFAREFSVIIDRRFFLFPTKERKLVPFIRLSEKIKFV